ncbi:MAG: hypothetical protein U1E76_07480 [Planctomycetota bacterium]
MKRVPGIGQSLSWMPAVHAHVEQRDRRPALDAVVDAAQPVVVPLLLARKPVEAAAAPKSTSPSFWPSHGPTAR